MKAKELTAVFTDHVASICLRGEKIGTVTFAENPCHIGHDYLQLDLEQYDPGIAKEVFSLLRQKSGKPFQMMVVSSRQDLAAFVRAAGFSCKRKCYEVVASAQDYVGTKMNHQLRIARVGSEIYEKCAQRMLNRYVQTHAAVNPWTGTAEMFFRNLPEMVFYEEDAQGIANLAFCEENEIAYVCGTDADKFSSFAQALITGLLDVYGQVFFEADDGDVYAMALKKLFTNQSEEHYDTYVL